MTKRDKILLLSSVLLAICVISTAVIYTVNSYRNSGNVNLESIIYVAAVVLIATSSVVIVYFKKVQKSKYEKMLNAAYIQEYEIIKDAIENSHLIAIRIFSRIVKIQKNKNIKGD